MVPSGEHHDAVPGEGGAGLQGGKAAPHGPLAHDALHQHDVAPQHLACKNAVVEGRGAVSRVLGVDGERCVQRWVGGLGQVRKRAGRHTSRRAAMWARCMSSSAWRASAPLSTTTLGRCIMRCSCGRIARVRVRWAYRMSRSKQEKKVGT